MKTPTKIINGEFGPELWPAEWSLRQCPYLAPGTDCELGGSPCKLPQESRGFLQDPSARCEHAKGGSHDSASDY